MKGGKRRDERTEKWKNVKESGSSSKHYRDYALSHKLLHCTCFRHLHRSASQGYRLRFARVCLPRRADNRPYLSLKLDDAREIRVTIIAPIPVMESSDPWKIKFIILRFTILKLQRF